MVSTAIFQFEEIFLNIKQKLHLFCFIYFRFYLFISLLSYLISQDSVSV